MMTASHLVAVAHGLRLADPPRWLWLGTEPLRAAHRRLDALLGPQRDWRRQHDWTLLQVGFGAGLDFIAALQAWKDDPDRPKRLFYVAIEPRPLSVPALRQALAAARVDGAAAERLEKHWPLALPGLHRLEFEGGRVVLTLGFGEPRRLLMQLALQADSLAIDTAVLTAEARAVGTAGSKLRTGGRATCVIRDEAGSGALAGSNALTGSGALAGIHPEALACSFAAIGLTLSESDVQTTLGDGRLLTGQRVQGPAVRRRPSRNDRSAMVIGAGIAGCAIAHGLARRGWTVTLIDRSPMPASGGSSQPMLAHHPSLSPDDAPLSRLTRQALLLARSLYDPGSVRWTGRWQAEAASRAQRIADRLDPGYARAVDAIEAASLTGLPAHLLGDGGLWLPLAGCADPLRLCQDWTADGVTKRFGVSVHRLEPAASGWNAIDADGRLLASAAVAVVACAADSLDLVTPLDAGCDDIGWPPQLQTRAGRSMMLVDELHANTTADRLQPRCVVGGEGYLLPLAGGGWLAGPIEQFESGVPEPAAASGVALPVTGFEVRRFLAATAAAAAASPVIGPPGWRAWCTDHLPLIGPVPDAAAIRAGRDTLRRDDRLPIPVRPDLWIAAAFGGRGLLWSVLAAEVIAAELNGEPPVLERDLLQAIDPRRFTRRAMRRAPI